MTDTDINTFHIVAGPVAFQSKRQDDGTVIHSIRIRTAADSGVVADLTEEQARFFFNQGQQLMGPREDDWTKLPTYVAVEADRRRIAARNAAV